MKKTIGMDRIPDTRKYAKYELPFEPAEGSGRDKVFNPFGTFYYPLNPGEKLGKVTVTIEVTKPRS